MLGADTRSVYVLASLSMTRGMTWGRRATGTKTHPGVAAAPVPVESARVVTELVGDDTLNSATVTSFATLLSQASSSRPFTRAPAGSRSGATIWTLANFDKPDGPPNDHVAVL